MIYKEACGCKHNGTRWVELCPADDVETKRLHAEAAADHARSKCPPSPARIQEKYSRALPSSLDNVLECPVSADDSWLDVG